MTARYVVGDVFDVLATLADDSVDLIVTSPPFLALRSYLPADHPDKAKELGSEATPGMFIDRMLDVVEACARVLAPHGSLVFELGDTYAGGNAFDKRDGEHGAVHDYFKPNPYGTASITRGGGPATDKNGNGWPLDKSKVLIPQLFAIALAYGFNPLTGRQTEPWRVRNTVAWCRPNPPVGRDGDKFRPATSFLTVACKARDRYWDGDAVRTPFVNAERFNVNTYEDRRAADAPAEGLRSSFTERKNTHDGAPLLDYWVIPTAPYKGSHYATYPPDLVVPLVKSMCPSRVCRVCGKPSTRIVATEYEPHGNAAHQNAEPKAHTPEGRQFGSYDPRPQGLAHGRATMRTETLGWSDCGHNDWRAGHVLDPFGGSGTTAAVATGHGFDCTLIDLDSRNADLARERVGMFLDVEYGSPAAPEALTIEPRF